ncbi:sugar ABC transporter ATP-binding protein [Vallitalea maricola]|uniref:Sugar ABC transporter ATP-binding protein n=1 Tax=Vallitalea maricola TaxID=3074433 RepID=A0ACB5UJ80_9FIRM|nr:sugar ABC transporter ATP-binding protein [Vallitalea sp. AN17-2]
MTANEILRLENISKAFSGVSVLRDINFSIQKGEVHAILGANGAGKSTLMKIISGVHKPTEGNVIYKGKRVTFNSPIEAQNQGIGIIYQELSIVKTLDVISNVFLGKEDVKRGFLNKKDMEKKYFDICKELKFNIKPYDKVSKLSISQQQVIEIMKVISNEAEIIIMDEPTTSLSESEKDSLFETIRQLKEKGKTILYISHMLDEIYRICDRMTVIRDGEYIGTYITDKTPKDTLISYMTGIDNINKTVNSSKKDKSKEEVVLELKNIVRDKVLDNISFKLHKGEILGIGGLVGAGRTELTQVIYGIDAYDSGDIYLNNKKIKISSPIDAIKNGIGLIPEDRKHLGLILKHEVYKNSTIIQLDKMKKFGFLSKKKEQNFIEKAIKDLSIKVESIKTKASNLSGGNQQKVVVSKWMDKDLQVLIFDEPTKGIDVSAKEDIFKIMVEFAEKGYGIIFISSDLEEVERLSDRVLIMRKGRIVKELRGKDITIEQINYQTLNG